MAYYRQVNTFFLQGTKVTEESVKVNGFAPEYVAYSEFSQNPPRILKKSWTDSKNLGESS